MCVTPAGKIGNCTCGMPKLLPHSGKKSSLLSLFNRSKTVSSHFLFLPLFHPEGSGVLNLHAWPLERLDCGLIKGMARRPTIAKTTKTNAGCAADRVQLATYPQSPFSGPVRCCDVTDL